MKENKYVDELKKMADPEDTYISENETGSGSEYKEKVFNISNTLEVVVIPGEKDIRQFMFSHNYRSISGWFGVIISITALVMLILGRNKYNAIQIVMLSFLATLFIVIQPLQIFLKSKRQIKMMDAKNHPVIYNLGEEGITIRQDEVRADVLWDDVYKVTETKNAYYIYTSAVRAFIFPKERITDPVAFKEIIDRKVRLT